jgi:hypothetical protein
VLYLDEVDAYSLSMNVCNNHIVTVLAFCMNILCLEDENMMLFKMSGTNPQVVWYYITEDRDLNYTDVKA